MADKLLVEDESYLLVSLSEIPRDIFVSLLIRKLLEIGWDFLCYIEDRRRDRWLGVCCWSKSVMGWALVI